MTTSSTTPTTPPSSPRMAPVAKVKILSTSTIEQRRIALLLFGEQDTGKTFCAFSFPDPFGMYFDTNLATLRKFKDIPFITPTSWQEMERNWIPAIRSRRLSELVGRKIQTVVVDSLTFFNASRQQEMTNKGKMEMSNIHWSELYAGLHALVQAGANATKPLSDQPDAETYHFVCTVHKTMRAGKKGENPKVVPTVDGQMRDQLFSFFDAVLCTDSQSVARTLPSEGGKPGKTVYEKQRFAWTVDPDQLTKSKNHVGPIDAKVIPTYANLSRSWGLDGISKATPTESPDEVGVEPSNINIATSEALSNV